MSTFSKSMNIPRAGENCLALTTVGSSHYVGICKTLCGLDIIRFCRPARTAHRPWRGKGNVPAMGTAICCELKLTSVDSYRQMVKDCNGQHVLIEMMPIRGSTMSEDTHG